MNHGKTPESASRTDTRTVRASRIRLVLGIMASLLYLLARTHTPIALHTENGHDDQLFISLAQQITSGHWLGAYNERTLIKGPGYPLFLAVNAWLGMPLPLTEALFQGMAIAVFFWTFARITRMTNLAVFGYVATLWMPAPYLERIMRDCIYPGQMLLIMAGLSAVLFMDMPRQRRYAWALGTGLVAGWFSLTREEGVWILPGAAVLIVAALAHREWRRQLKVRIVAPLAMILLGYGVTQLAFASINKIVYGSFVRVETVTRPFTDAMAAMQSVQAGPQIPYVPVSKQARAAIYRVSPTFLSLKDYLDPPAGSPWQFGCQVYPQTCGDIAGGWFQWAVRDAVTRQGLYRSPKTAAIFYRQVAAEIRSACREGKLQCKPLAVNMVPRIAASQWAQLPRGILQGIAMITQRQRSQPDIPSSGTPVELASDQTFLSLPSRTPGKTDEETYSVNGWYYGHGEKGWITGKLASGDTMEPWPISRSDSPDLVNGFGDPAAAHQRFSVTVRCQSPCIFGFVNEAGKSVEIPLPQETGHASSHPLDGATVNIDRIDHMTGLSLNDDARYRFASAWRARMETVYGHVLPWLLPLALLAMAATLVICAVRRSLTVTAALATAFWALLVSRLSLLGLVDISSFPAFIEPYLSPGYVLASLLPTVSFASLYDALASRRQGGAESVPSGERSSRLRRQL